MRKEYYKGENLGQYLLIHTSNNTLTTGDSTKWWYESRKGSFDEGDCWFSEKTIYYGFGPICVSDGCLAIAYFYLADSNTGYCLVN